MGLLIDSTVLIRGERLLTSDPLIAYSALARGDQIVTGDARHFCRVPGLAVHLLP